MSILCFSGILRFFFLYLPLKGGGSPAFARREKARGWGLM